MLQIKIFYTTGETHTTSLNPNADQEFIKRYFRPGTVHDTRGQVLKIKGYEVKESQLIKLDETNKIALELAFADYLTSKGMTFEKIKFHESHGLHATLNPSVKFDVKQFTQCGFMDDRIHKYVRLGIKDILNDRITGGFFSSFSLGMQTIIKEPQEAKE